MDHIGRITLHATERVTHETVMEQKKNSAGEFLFINPAGVEVTASSNAAGDIFYDPIMRAEKDDDGTADRIRAIDGSVSIHALDVGDQIVPGSEMVFAADGLPQEIRNDIIAVFAKIRAAAATGYGLRLDVTVRGRK